MKFLDVVKTRRVAEWSPPSWSPPKDCHHKDPIHGLRVGDRVVALIGKDLVRKGSTGTVRYFGGTPPIGVQIDGLEPLRGNAMGLRWFYRDGVKKL